LFKFSQRRQGGRATFQLENIPCVGASDENGLTKPKAYCVLRDAGSAGPDMERELIALIKERLAPFKYPRWIEFVDELPKTASGKIQRFKLRAA
jgi:benzoate-CoA ligase